MDMGHFGGFLSGSSYPFREMGWSSVCSVKKGYWAECESWSSYFFCLYASEEKEDMILGTSKGCYKFPFEDEFGVLGCALNRQGKTCEAEEERMQSANKSFWKDIMTFKSKDAPWRVKCQRLVDHVVRCLLFWK